MSKRSIDTILDEYFAEGVNAFLPHVSINCVVLGYQHPQLKVLVHRLPGQEYWMLPGGHVKKEEDIDDAAYRNLKLSGIDQVFLRQIRTFGDACRVPAETLANAGQVIRNAEIRQWVTQRFVTAVYYGLVNFKKTKLVPGGLAIDSRWQDVNKLDNLVLDHAAIISETRKMLVNELQNHPVASSLLPNDFTLNELRGLYEAILNRSIDRGTFRRKMLQQGIIEQVETRQQGRGRPSFLYRFNQEAYLNSLKEKARFGF